MQNKKGLVSLITFSLLIVIFIFIFSSSYYYYSTSKVESKLIVKQIDIQNVLISFRADLLNLVSHKNSTLNYTNLYVSDSFSIKLNNSKISGIDYFEENLIQKNISNLGINFCSSYTIYPVITNIFYFNGSCISKIS